MIIIEFFVYFRCRNNEENGDDGFGGEFNANLVMSLMKWKIESLENWKWNWELWNWELGNLNYWNYGKINY